MSTVAITAKSGGVTPMMALGAAGDKVSVVTGKITIGTYATGGVAMVIPGLKIVDAVFIETNGTYLFKYSGAKCLGYSALGTEVANGTNLSGVTVGFLAVGRRN